MKKLLCALLTLCLLLCACNTGKTIDDPNILTGIYAPVLTGLGTSLHPAWCPGRTDTPMRCGRSSAPPTPTAKRCRSAT